MYCQDVLYCIVAQEDDGLTTMEEKFSVCIVNFSVFSVNCIQC